MTTKNREGTQGTPKKEAFLEAYTRIGTVSGGAKGAGVDRRTIYKWLEKDKEFGSRFEEAKETVTDDLEQEARRRAYEGIDKGVYWQGQLCDTIKEYSDTLLIFLLKGNRPEKYRERLQTELSGSLKVYRTVEE